MRSRQKALRLADFAKAKKAEDIVILDMRKLSNVTDFSVLVTASSTRRAQAITDNIETALLEMKEPISDIEGYKEAEWILLDGYDVVVHVFNDELRKFYNLEGLWSKAKRIKLCQKKKQKLLKKTSKRK